MMNILLTYGNKSRLSLTHSVGDLSTALGYVADIDRKTLVSFVWWTYLLVISTVDFVAFCGLSSIQVVINH